MIVPLNNHVLLAPIKHEDFVEGANSFDEIGEVLAVDETFVGASPAETNLAVGDIVYFDSYLCARYPSPDPEKPYWLVDYKDIRAKNAPTIPEQPVQE